MNLESTPLEQRPNRRWATEKHLRWLFERQALVTSWADIARREHMTEEDAVRKACQRLAKEMDLQMRIHRKV